MTSEGKLLDAAEEAHRRAGAKVAALLDGPAIGQDRAGRVQPLRARSELERELAQAQEALERANLRSIELDGAVIELQAVLGEALAYLRGPRYRRVREGWRERLGAYWPQDAG